MPQARPRRSITVVLVSLLLLVAAVLLIGLAVQRLSPLAGRLGQRESAEVTHGVVVEQVRAVARLVSSETSVRDVVVYQNRRLGSTKRSLVVVTGKVLAGIDLDAGTQVDIDHAARQVRVSLPPAQVLGVEVTQLRTYDERSGLWNPFRPEDRDTIYDLARQQLIAAAGELELRSHAEESARQLLTALINPEGYQVEVTFKARQGDKLGAMEEVSFLHRGKQITAALNRNRTLSGSQAPGQEEPPTWYVTIGATALTKLPATPADTEASVRARILAWLEANPDLLDRDQIVLGGG